MTLELPTVFISGQALRHNLAVVRQRVSPAELMAVIKDDAYGHSQELVLEILVAEGVTRFGTLDVPSSLAVRQRCPAGMIFAWVIDSKDDISGAIRAAIDLGVGDLALLERVAIAARSVSLPARVHLKLDSGLHRAGTLPEQWPTLISRAAQLQAEGLITVSGLWTHLSEASEEVDTHSIALFRSAVDVARQAGLTTVTRHLAASAAAFSREDARFDMVRVGAFLYGIGPGDGIGPAELGLVPVMTVRAPIVAVVRHGDQWFAEIAVGTVSGMLSEAAGRVAVAIDGNRYPLSSVGVTRSLIDISVMPATVRATVGDTVTLFGSGLAGESTLAEWADALGTIGEELACRVSDEFPRLLTA
jgi:alanine racemase